MTRLLTQAEVAELLGISERTVEDWRYGRTGPPCVAVGRLVRYREEDVEAWIESKPRQFSAARSGRVAGGAYGKTTRKYGEATAKPGANPDGRPTCRSHRGGTER